MKLKIALLVLVTAVLTSAGIFTAQWMTEVDSESTSKHFSGIRIIFFVGGNEDHYFARPVYNGARAAERDLGCEVEYVFSDWEAETIIKQFKEAIESKPDAICLMGHPGDGPLEPLIREAIEKGIIITTQNVPLPKNQQLFQHAGLGYVGADNFKHGYRLAQMSLKRFDMKPGDKVGVLGSIERIPGSITSDRSLGAMAGFREQGFEPVYLEMGSDQAVYKYEVFLPRLKNFLEEHPDIKAVVLDIETGFWIKALDDLNIPHGKIKAAAFDLSKDTLGAVKSGAIGLAIDQQPFLQGYLPILQACMTKKYGMSGIIADTGSGFIDQSNINLVEELAKNGFR